MKSLDAHLLNSTERRSNLTDNGNLICNLEKKQDNNVSYSFRLFIIPSCNVPTFDAAKRVIEVLEFAVYLTYSTI